MLFVISVCYYIFILTCIYCTLEILKGKENNFWESFLKLENLPIHCRSEPYDIRLPDVKSTVILLSRRNLQIIEPTDQKFYWPVGNFIALVFMLEINLESFFFSQLIELFHRTMI